MHYHKHITNSDFRIERAKAPASVATLERL